MRRPTLGQILLLAAIGGAVFVTVTMPGIWKKLFLQAQGFDVAQTPQQCVDFFQKAVKARNYQVAADMYLAGDYREQMAKAAVAARELGKSIDSLLGQMQVKDMDSPRVRWLLMAMEPIPADFTPSISHSEGNDTARFVLTEDKKLDFREDVQWNQTIQGDATFFRALCGGPAAWVLGRPTTIGGEMKLEGSGKEKGWRMRVPIDNDTRIRVDRLVKKYKTYKKVMEKLHYQVTNEPMTKADFETAVKTEIETAARD